MDDSDDLYDSFDLDENDLAILDQAEVRYIQEASQKCARPAKVLPPTKRRKTRHTYDSDDDIVDVFVRPDGTYALESNAIRKSGSHEINVTQQSALSSVNRNRQTATTQGGVVATQSLNPTQEPRRNILPQSQSSRRPNNISNNRYNRPLQPLPRNSSTQVTHVVRQNVPGVGGHIPQNKPPHSQENPAYQKQLAELTARVEKLQTENIEIKEALKSAEVARYTKEGEVTILRKKLENAAQQHSEDVVKLKDSKDIAEKERIKLQNEMKEQLERLRTDFIFKQHELEASARKVPLSARTRRIGNGTQFSPVPIPPVMRSWRTGPAPESPTKARANGSIHSSQLKLRVPKTPHRQAIGAPNFPGFENSFLPSSPEKSPSRRQSQRPFTANGSQWASRLRDDQRSNPSSPVRLSPLSKQRHPSIRIEDEDFMMIDAIQDFNGDADLHDGSPRRKRTVKHGLITRDNENEDFMSSDPVMDPNEEQQFEPDMLDSIDWEEELRYLLFTHTTKKAGALTFHYLLSAPVSLEQTYQNACSIILEALSSKIRISTYELTNQLVEGFVNIALCLWEGQSDLHLRALFDLMTTILLYIPSFNGAIFRSIDGGFERNQKLIRVLCEIATKSVERLPSLNEDFQDLIHSSLELLEAMGWTIDEHNFLSLLSVVNPPAPFLSLLDRRQPGSIISHTIKTLLVLSTHTSLAKSIAMPGSGQALEEMVGNLPVVRNLLIESVCHILVEPNVLPEHSLDDDIISLLNFLSLVICASPESKLTMSNTLTLVPCLIHYLSRLSTLIWDEEERIMQSPNLLGSTIRNLKQTLYVLHQVVISSGSTANETPSTMDFNLRQKIYHTPSVIFSSLPHMFIVTISRLSYADPPGWLPSELQTEIVNLTEPARDILDLVIGGPEGDSLWEAYQYTEDQSEAQGVTAEDIDEMEASLMDVESMEI